jgi:archaellum component FlaG (FlaF/FlaG flagellin family)
MSYPKCRGVEVINNPARPGSNYREVNYIKLYIKKRSEESFEM